MAVGTGTLYPAAFDDFPIMTASNYVQKPETNKQSAALAALERKVGVNGSASGTSIDYKLSAIEGTAKALPSSGTTVLEPYNFVNTTVFSGTTNVPTPSENSQAANKIYVDGASGGNANFESGTTIVSAGGGDVSVALSSIADWTGGSLELHSSGTTSDYFTDVDATPAVFKTSHLALTSGVYTNEQVEQLLNRTTKTAGYCANGDKDADTPGIPKSAGTTNFVLHDDGANTRFIKWFITSN